MTTSTLTRKQAANDALTDAIDDERTAWYALNAATFEGVGEYHALAAAHLAANAAYYAAWDASIAADDAHANGGK